MTNIPDDDKVRIGNTEQQPIDRSVEEKEEEQHAIGKVLSLVRTRESGYDPGPPPDGGFRAWLHVFTGHLVLFNSWGYCNAFGVFQAYYTKTLNRPPSDVSWIGSVQLFLLLFIGTFSGRATDAGYFKVVYSAGVVTILFGVFMTSLCKEYWQLLLAQGFCMGLGFGLAFCPTVSLVATYFAKRRAVALAATATGAASGGIVFPITVQLLIPRIGFGWTVRVLGLITLVTMAPGFVIFRQRVPPRRSGPLFDWPAFKERPYAFFTIGTFVLYLGLYVAYFYISTFSRDVVGLSQIESIYLLMIMNAMGSIGRLLPSFLADWKTGPLNIFILTIFFSGILMFGWIGVQDRKGLYAFSILYGFCSSGTQSLFPATVTSLTTDIRKTGIRLGMALSMTSVAYMIGSPIAGALIQRRHGDYLYAQLYGGASIILSLPFLISARYSAAGSSLKARV